MSASTSYMQQWDPTSVLNIYPAHGPLTCSGKAQQGTRRCGWELPSETEIQIWTVLAQMASLQPIETLRCGLVRRLAFLALCEGRKNERFNGHRWQINQLMQEWTTIITQVDPQVQPLHPVQPLVLYTATLQQQQVLVQQSTVSAVSELPSYRPSVLPAIRSPLSSETMFKQEKPSIEVRVTEVPQAISNPSQNRKGSAHRPDHRQYSQGSSLTNKNTSYKFHGGYEECYPKPRGLLRRMLGCFCC